MGCDGGTIPRRDELVRTKKKPEQKDKKSELSFKWGHCSLSQEPLQCPIVACQLGRLYSKVAVIEALLDRQLPDSHKHIKSLKDVKELNLTPNPDYKDSDTKSDSCNDGISPFICPVIGLEMNGKYRFVYYWSCGCVVSERALKAVKSKVCHKCQKAFTNDDIVILNGTDDDIKIMTENMKQRQIKIKAEKKEKKCNKSETSVSADKSQNIVESTSNVNSATASNAPKAVKKRCAGNIEIEDPDFKKTKLNYSVAKDPKATEVFKSLFTSHKSADKQLKAHWVTYNPFYN